MTEQKKSALTAGTVIGAKVTSQKQFTPNSGKKQDRPDTHKAILDIVDQQEWPDNCISDLYKIRNRKDVQRDFSLNSTGLFMLYCFSYGVIVGKRQERTKSRKERISANRKQIARTLGRI